jgi:ketosteroid isomerase-like protein
MSKATEAVERWYEAIRRADMEAAKLTLHPDIEWNIAAGFPAGGKYIGHEAVFDDFFVRSWATWVSISPEVDELINAGDTVVSLGRYMGITRESQVPFNAPFAHVWRVRGDRIAALDQYVDTLMLQRAIEGDPFAPSAS